MAHESADFITRTHNPEEAFSGVDNFAEQCIRLGELAATLKAVSLMDISTESGRNGALVACKTLNYLNHGGSQEQVEDVLAEYEKRLQDLISLKNLDLGADELFKDAFGSQPLDNVEIDWLAGGLVLWCSETDYEAVMVTTRRTSVDSAKKRAEGSQAVAVGDIYLTSNNFLIPVTVVKCDNEEKNRFFDGAIPEQIDLDSFESMYITYEEGGVSKEHVIFPSPDKEDKTLHVINLVQAQEYEDHSEFDMRTGPIEQVSGPFSWTIDENGLVVDLIAGVDRFANINLDLVTNEAYDADGKVKQSYKELLSKIVEHEIQHLVNNLYIPVRFKAEKFPPVVSDADTAVKNAANFVLKGPLDKDLRDEFLAQMNNRSSLKAIRYKLMVEVEYLGVLYDYLGAHTQLVKRAIRPNRHLFANPAAATYSVLAETAGEYRGYVRAITQCVIQFEEKKLMSREQVIGLLAPHPFHAWPIVLRAVERRLQEPAE